jgi:hypothetical protein
MTELNSVQAGAPGLARTEQDLCAVCASPREPIVATCPHCCVPYSGGIPDYDNVLHARSESAELDALFEATRRQYGHSDAWLTQFQEILDRTFAVMCRDLTEIYRMVVNRGAITRGYDSGIYQYGNPEDHELWEERRDHAERGLFRRYGPSIRYANLSGTGRGVGGKFGDCVIHLRDITYQHRATVFIDNSAAWYEEQVVRHGGFDKVPKGYRAEWSMRARLAYVKFAGDLPADRPPDPDAVEELLLPNWPQPTSQIEVNVLGSITPHSAKKFLFPVGSEGNYLYERAKDILTTLGIETGGCVWTR